MRACRAGEFPNRLAKAERKHPFQLTDIDSWLARGFAAERLEKLPPMSLLWGARDLLG
jgi:hypothetical protein